MIKGNVVCIRNVKNEDLDSLYTLSNDFIDAGFYMPISLSSWTSFISEFKLNGFWVDFTGKLIIENFDGDIVGEAGFFKSTHYINGREVYYRIFSGHRGKGYASDALNLLIKLFFESSSFSRLQAVTVNGNSESEHILIKNGFKKEGIMRSARHFRGELVDLNLFSIIRKDWLSQ
ncbi:GNAT family N-acetyltransferase [Pseudoalteromonas xiamenensis]|uniref:GNAT family N-acetyltransferase n=1 Tax=Pseudoalteromonas xiamenensis TaxID=882626 RepID=A0A975HMH6_9GAMM|nr:GNAT family protein [Pseudoalteromonas xiamenensis]QTH73002.1 GNAT family N-acetyltransferase [Pseudoalteromonas xiamenensis]